ncbi:hypothetical protein ACGVWS_12440 [Enterobacteriaceae bacterium LUAb1]
MSADLRCIAERLGVFLLCALFIALMTGIIWMDVCWLDNGIKEISLTEGTQEVILLIVSFLWFRVARCWSHYRELAILIGGFFSCMLIRELDFLFDLLHHGSWLWFALLCTAVCIVLAFRHPVRVIHDLALFVRHPCWGMMAAGLLTILVFSRLYGMGTIWQHLMAENYVRTVKNMAEEGCELLGYSLCLLSTLIWLVTEKSKGSVGQD